MSEYEHTPSDLSLTDDAITRLIKQYCREAGVRNLQNQIEKIFRKIALRVVSADSEDHDGFTVEANSLEKYVGKPIFISDRMYDVLRPGIVMGLAWTSMVRVSKFVFCLSPTPLFVGRIKSVH